MIEEIFKISKDHQQLLFGILIAMVGFYVAERYRRSIENKKRAKDFHSKDYEDLWEILNHINDLIQRGHKIDHDKVMGSIKQKYSCIDINAYLKRPDYIITRNKKLYCLLIEFSDILTKYEESYTRLQFPSMGDEQIDFKNKSKVLMNKIHLKIKKNLNI